MSTATAPIKIPRSIFDQLRRLRRKMTNWIVVHGLGRWLLVVLAVLAVDMLLDRLFKMDFAQRLIMLCVMAIIAGVYFGWRLIRPLMYGADDDALLFRVEESNQDLNESLITSFQLARRKDLNDLGVSPELTNETIRRGVEQAEKIDFGNSLDREKSLTNWLILGVGLILFGLLAVGVNQSDFFRTWFNRNILLGNDQWPQGTYLEIVGAEDGKLIVARGADKRQLVNILDTSSITDVPVSIEIDGPGGRTIHQMKSTGQLEGRQHVFVFHNVSSQFRFRASGGDDTTDWVNIELVEPPSIANMDLKANLPKYTGIESMSLDGTGPHSILTGSSLDLKIVANKPLYSAVVKNGDEIFNLKSESGDNLNFSLKIPAENGAKLNGGDYEFELIDETKLRNTRKSKFTITIKEDRIPKVRASLLGISGLVVPRARLPVSYTALDEYGLTKIAFDTYWKFDEDPDQSKLIPLANLETERVKSGLQAANVEILDLEPLQLQAGTSFRFAVQATDNCPGTPGLGKSQEFLLRVVTDEELRADLLRREVEQRKAFEQAYNAQLELTGELQAVAAMAPDGQDQAKFDSDRESRIIALNRDQKLVGTNVERVASRYEEFLVEAKNNRLDEAENEIDPSQRIEVRFDQGIIQPIRRMDQELISLSNRYLDNCRQNIRDQDGLNAAVQQAVAVQTQILERMKTILDSMVDSENFQELVNKLLEIKSGEQKLKDAIKNKTKKDNIFDEDDGDGIFDDDK